jgi:predicted RNase H-like HicB family nuclease
MATFISVVRGSADSGYTASVPDFPEFAVQAWTLDHVLAKAREALARHVERLLVDNETIPDPTSADAIEPGDALLLAAIDVPDDMRNVQIDLAIPALSLARIDSFAGRNGLTRASLFVRAVDRWIVQETSPRHAMSERSTGPTLFDFSNPLELKMETMGTTIDRLTEAVVERSECAAADDVDVERSIDNITQELQRLLEEGTHPEPMPGRKKDG